MRSKVRMRKAEGGRRIERGGERPALRTPHSALPNFRRGMTLVELMVVVMIMVILLGIAIPALKPALEDRKVREASRQLNAFLRAAQSRAAQANRSVGVWFARTDGVNPNISYQIYYAETPPPYVGDTTDAQVHNYNFYDVPATGPFDHWEGEILLTNAFSAGVQNVAEPLVQAGDLIQFNYAGPFYLITTIDPTDTSTGLTRIVIRALASDVHSLPSANAPRHLPRASAGGVGARFQIHRTARRTTAGALSLPNGTAVVLSLSGLEGVIARNPNNNNLLADRNEFLAPGPVAIMFRPDGAVDRVYYDSDLNGRLDAVLPDGPIHLLVGRAIVDERIDPAAYSPGATQIPPATDDPLTWQNLYDLNNLWIVVNHRTGAITTSPTEDWQILYANDAANPDRDTLVQKTRYARVLTRGGLSVGGK